MKKLVIPFVVIGLLFGCTFAYTPTNRDVTALALLEAQFDTISSGDMQAKGDFYIQLKTLQEQFSGQHEKLNFYLNTLASYIINQVNTSKLRAKVTSKTFKTNFRNQYSGGFSKEITTADSCTGWYNTMDNISFANNFPTALTIATRYREANCGYYLPDNGDGPFQILSKEYGTGQITEAKFLQTVQDFIDFSKAKRAQYHSRLGINLTYTGFDRTGLVNHAALYNGGTISGNMVTPIHPNYLYDGYGQAYSGATRYGLVPKFLKVLHWELENSY